jgi:hypothetical protein
MQFVRWKLKEKVMRYFSSDFVQSNAAVQLPFVTSEILQHNIVIQILYKLKRVCLSAYCKILCYQNYLYVDWGKKI